MSLKEFLSELRRRGVLKTAAAYLAIGWVVLEGLSLLFQNFDAPGWVIKVVTSLIILGFPVACLMSWGFDITREGVRPVPPVPKDRAAPPEASITARQMQVQETSGSPSIAVLPFVDMSAEQDQQYLGDGIAEELLNALAAIEGLNVAARTSSFVLAGRDASMKEIGTELNVEHVLEGSVRRSGQKLRVTAQLIEVKSGFHRFTQSYDREVQDIFAIQNDIAREIVTALLPKLGLAEDVRLVRQGTTNLQAYNLWLKAHQALTQPSAETLRIAIQGLNHAIELDPTYGDAWGDLSYAYCFLSTWDGDPMPSLVNAATAATVARSHAPKNGTASMTEACISAVVHFDPVTARSYFDRARAEGVDESDCAFLKAHALYGPSGEYDQAITELKEAERSDPLSPNLKQGLMEMYVGAGRVAEAVEVAESVLRPGLNAPGPMLVAGLAFLAAGDTARAQRILVAMRGMTGDEFMYTLLLQFNVDAATGNRTEAMSMLERLLRGYSEGQSVPAYAIGEGYKALGDYDEMFVWWTRAVDQHHPLALVNIPIRNRRHPVFGKDPRFLALLKRMGLAGEKKGAG